MNRKRIITIILIGASIISLGVNSYAHSGRTDSSGGHKDNQNKSGLGSYHYHCGGHPAHLHTNGVCPYSSNGSSAASNSKSSTSSSSSSSVTTTATTPSEVVATSIEINEEIRSMKVGENKNLTATITPNNATDKTITWKSSDENIATISESGIVVAKKAGIVTITASTTNDKTDSISIDIEEKEKVNDNNTSTVQTTSTSGNITNNTGNNNSNDSNPAGGIITLGLLGGGYLGYKKYKKSKE